MPLPLVDVHAHMSDDAFRTDLEEVLRRAAARGGRAIITVSDTPRDAHRILSLAERYPLLKPCAGLHPSLLDLGAAEEVLSFAREHRDRLVGIGEIGLDYWQVKDDRGRELQRRIFARQIRTEDGIRCPIPGMT